MNTNPCVITRTQIGQALECAYIEAKELEEVIDNIHSLLETAWEQGAEAEASAACMNPPCGACDGCFTPVENPYKESE